MYPARSMALLCFFMAASLSLSIASQPASQQSLLLTDFTAASADLGWFVVNDNVMGGRSQGGFERAPDGLRFAGRTNTNGGGFSSIRTDGFDLDMSSYDGIRVRVLGDGRRYTWRITTDARWRGRPVSYWAEFETRNGAWSEVDIPWSSFTPRFRGYELDGPPIDASRIAGMGLMIYDGNDGAFELFLDRVEAWSAPPDHSAWTRDECTGTYGCRPRPATPKAAVTAPKSHEAQHPGC